jgi:hypothetical protein
MGFDAEHQDGATYWHAEDAADGLDDTCGGTGILHCYCGGDFCCCGNFGEVECPGCEDCEGDEFDDWDDD